MNSRKESTSSRKEISSQRAVPKKHSVSGKKENVELPKRNLNARKISSFAPILLHQQEPITTDNNHQTENVNNEADIGEEDTQSNNSVIGSESKSTDSALWTSNIARKSLFTEPTSVINETGKDNTESKDKKRSTDNTEKNANEDNTRKAIQKEEANMENKIGSVQNDTTETTPCGNEMNNATNAKNSASSSIVLLKASKEDDSTKKKPEISVAESNQEQDAIGSTPTPIDKKTTNVPQDDKDKPAERETSIVDPSDIENIQNTPNKNEEKKTKGPPERVKLKVSFTSDNQIFEQTNQTVHEEINTHQEQLAAKNNVGEFKPKKKEVSFRKPNKEAESGNRDITPNEGTPDKNIDMKENRNARTKRVVAPNREAVTKTGAKPKRDSTPKKDVSTRRGITTRKDVSPQKDETPTRRDVSPKRDESASGKISKIPKVDAQVFNKQNIYKIKDPSPPEKESIAKGLDPKAGNKHTDASSTNGGGPRKLTNAGKTPYQPTPKKKSSTAQEPSHVLY